MVSKEIFKLIDRKDIDKKEIDKNNINYPEISHSDNYMQPISSNYTPPQVQSDVAPADSFLNLLVNPYGGGG